MSTSIEVDLSKKVKDLVADPWSPQSSPGPQGVTYDFVLERIIAHVFGVTLQETRNMYLSMRQQEMQT